MMPRSIKPIDAGISSVAIHYFHDLAFICFWLRATCMIFRGFFTVILISFILRKELRALPSTTLFTGGDADDSP